MLDDLELQDIIRQSYEMVATKAKVPARKSGAGSRKLAGQTDLTPVRKLG